MAQYELEAPPGTTFINLYLVTKFPSTTNTQLVSLRKTRRYKNILDSVAQEQATRSNLHAQNNEQSGDSDSATELINIQAAPEAPSSNAHNNEQGGDLDTTTELINIQAAPEAPSSYAQNIGNISGDISTATVNPINNLDFSTALTNAINWSLLPEGASFSSSVEMLNEDLSALIPS